MKKRISILLLCMAPAVFAQKFTLQDFYKKHHKLDKAVNTIYASLSDTTKVGQMIITSYGHNGKAKKTIDPLVKSGKIGGIIYLKGTKEEHFTNTMYLNGINTSLPLLFSMDAEPSLMKGRISTFPAVPKTNEIKTIQQNDSVATLISEELKSIGVLLNFAPDCDKSTSNEAIGSRSYGTDTDTIVAKANSFINISAQLGVLTCAKHFPGHGLVSGDSHHQRVFIDGDLQELDVYEKLIENPNLIAIMVGHIDVINNEKYQTNDIPASCSEVIVKKLLKKELGFKGLVVTDALGMKALDQFEVPGLEAFKAGCDILCMPKDEEKLIQAILTETQKHPEYALQLEQSVKKIIRLKLCLGLLKL